MSYKEGSKDTATVYHLPVTFGAYKLLDQLDKQLIGTNDYMGLAYFWAYEYRHYLRDATHVERKRVHDRWLAAGLELTGESPEHLAIIKGIGTLRNRMHRDSLAA